MTVTLTTTQVAERLTVTLTCASAASLPEAYIIVDGKAYLGILVSGSYIFSYDFTLERGSHVIYGQVWIAGSAVTTASITYTMAYELTEYGIDIYSGDALLDVIEPVLHDELLPALPTLNFSCATLLTGTIGAVIRERGVRKYQFEIATVAISGPLYVYTCKAAESYALTTAIMALQTAYGATSDAIRLLIPSLNIINVGAWASSTVNLISGGTFEVDGEGWWSNYSTITRTTVSPLVGAGSLKMVARELSRAYSYPQGGFIVGHTYCVSGLMKSTAAAGRKCRVTAYYGSPETTGASVDCSVSAQTVSVVFTTVGTVMYFYFALDVDGVSGESFLLDSVVCHDITIINNINLLERTTYPQMFTSIAPVDVIKQLLIQALAQASVRNGNLYVFSLDVSGQIPDYHMQRLDPLTGWQKDADTFDAVIAHYIVKQSPTPDTVLTLHDAANWIGTVSDVTQVDTTLLPVSSGALGMLKSIGNCSRAGLNAAFKNFDRVRFNWDPVTATSLTVSLQQDVSNKLEIVHTFAGQQGAGFILNTGTASTDILTKTITLSSVQFVTKVTGTTTANCSYRVTLLRYGGTTLWQDGWRATIGNTFEADVPYPSSESQTQTVIIEFKDLYLVDGVHYGVQCVTCDIAVQTWTNVGSHVQVDSTVVYQAALQISSSQIVDTGDYRYYSVNIFYCNNVCAVPALVGGQWYTIDEERADVTGIIVGTFHSTVSASGAFLTWGPYYWDGRRLIGFPATGTVYVTVSVKETVQDYTWVPSTFAWSSAFNLFESVDIALNTMTRTGNPVTLQAIVLTWAGDNYLDTLVLVADNPLPVTVRAGTGQRAYTVTEDFGSEAGALAYANGLLPIVSVVREQYTLDVPLETDLSVGDTISGDGVPMTVYAVDYRQSGKTLAAGRAMDTLMTRLSEQARRLGTLERKG